MSDSNFDDLLLLLDIFLPDMSMAILDVFRQEDGTVLLDTLIEVVLDLGRVPEIRTTTGSQKLKELPKVDEGLLTLIVEKLGNFGDDNRTGISGTLHRISAIRNRYGKIVGLTCRVGRAIYGTAECIRDLAATGKSILLLGYPGVGKTTKLRELVRLLSDDMDKRTVVIDTSNEIAGDGDIPHPAIGSARRMQVAHSKDQHAVMEEAVCNHFPQVIVIDEIGNELEVAAARTIAERGVQLIATAHGMTIDNLLKNPAMNDLLGGVRTVTLGDAEAKKRGTSKSVPERQLAPTFDIVIELIDRFTLVVHEDTAKTVDALLKGQRPVAMLRTVDENGKTFEVTPLKSETPILEIPLHECDEEVYTNAKLFLHGVNSDHVHKLAQHLGMSIKTVRRPSEATHVIITKRLADKEVNLVADARSHGASVIVLRANTYKQIETTLRGINGGHSW